MSSGDSDASDTSSVKACDELLELDSDTHESAASTECGCDDPHGLGQLPELIKDPTSTPNSEEDDLEHYPEVVDVLIIGGGPCGLAAAARIREPAPSAMFTDEEHKRWTWLKKHGKKVAIKVAKTGDVIPAKIEHEHEYTLAVLDATDDQWLGRWKDRFATFGIRHLRSPMLWHVDPQDRDSLLRHAERNGTKKDMIEIKGCVGREISKHHKKGMGRAKFTGNTKDAKVNINYREVNDYHTPSHHIFCDHCENVSRHYNLHEGLLHKETVRDIRYGIADEAPGANNVFTVVTDKSVRYARAVILAVGPANEPALPKIPKVSFPGQSPDFTAMPQAGHSMKIQLDHFPDLVVQKRIQNRQTTNLLVVGGGLTSAQLADLAIKKGVTKVWHIMRGPLKRKVFDVGLEWMGKYKTWEQAAFHQADTDEERLKIIKDARDGGSITPKFYQESSTPHLKSGKLEMFTYTELTEAHFEGPVDGKGGKWKIKTEPPIKNLPPMDFLCFATGIQSDYAKLPYLQTMMEKHPIQGVGGFPCLNEDLMWQDDVPLFVAGRLAALRLGPAAANIGGARIGAERIALALDSCLASGPRRFMGAELDSVKNGERGGEVDRINYALGVGNMYAALRCSLPEVEE